MRATWDRARRMATAGAAGVLLSFGLLTPPAHAAPQASAEPKDALTLVRQALAALEVTPPVVPVATAKVIKALFAQDAGYTREVDMARVQEAAQALGQEDAAAAAADLIAALRPAQAEPGGVDVALLTPVRPRFAGTPAEYALLVGAALLVAGGGLVIRR